LNQRLGLNPIKRCDIETQHYSLTAQNKDSLLDRRGQLSSLELAFAL